MNKLGRTRSGGLRPLSILILILIPILAIMFSLCIGRISVSPKEVVIALWAKVFGGEAASSQSYAVIWNMRMPRIILAALVGAGLSVSGCAFQSLFSNPLATPDTVGVASGASFGAAVAILLGFGLFGIQAFAVVFGIGAVLLTVIAVRGHERGMNSIVLSGIMIGSLFTALVSLVKFAADTESQLPAITYWLMGSLNMAGFKTILMGAPLIIIGIFVIFLLRWKLNILSLTEDEARATGTNLSLLRVVIIAAASCITASCVSMCGQVGWVGLLVPHMCRMRYGQNHMAIVPASICVGAGFMIVIDTVARSISAAEIPVSILTAIIGAPFFIVLMRKTGGWQV